jgi:hypothetical protein
MLGMPRLDLEGFNILEVYWVLVEKPERRSLRQVLDSGRE